MFCFEVMSPDARGSAGDFTLVNLLLFGVSRSCHIFCIRFPRGNFGCKFGLFGWSIHFFFVAMSSGQYKSVFSHINAFR